MRFISALLVVMPIVFAIGKSFQLSMKAAIVVKK
jgi:hypothetical protein